MVNECRMPAGALLVAVGNIDVGGLCMAKILHPDVAGGVEALGEAYGDAVASSGVCQSYL